MQCSNVCPDRIVPTDAEVRRMVAEPMLRLSYAEGIDATAVALGINEKTVRRARDEEATVHATTLIALFRRDRSFREALLAVVGERPVPLDAYCDSDPIVTTSAAIHSIAAARSPLSDGGAVETDRELLAMEDQIEAAATSLAAIKARIIKIKLEREQSKRGSVAA